MPQGVNGKIPYFVGILHIYFLKVTCYLLLLATYVQQKYFVTVTYYLENKVYVTACNNITYYITFENNSTIL